MELCSLALWGWCFGGWMVMLNGGRIGCTDLWGYGRSRVWKIGDDRPEV